MGKLQDYSFRKLRHQQLEDFKDDVRELVNFGKFQYQYLSSTTAPTLAGNAGEAIFVHDGTAGNWYVYSGFAWDLVAAYTATTG